MPEREVQSSTATDTMFDPQSIEEKYHCKIDVERAEAVLYAALDEYSNHELGFFKKKRQAEEDYVNFLIEQGESNEGIANALLLLSMVTFGSSSEVFYNSLPKDRATHQRDRLLLIPSEVVKMKLIDPKAVKRLKKYENEIPKLPGLGGEKNEKKPQLTKEFYDESFNKKWSRFIKEKGRQGEAMEGWYEDCKVLCEKYDGSVFNLFKACDDDAVKVMHALTYKPGGKSSNKEIKRFEKKLASLFLQWIGTYHLYELSNMEEFGLPVDFQLCRIAVQTGIIDVIPENKIRRKEFANNIFLPIIAFLCKKNGWEPRLVSESLWLIGSQGCSKDQKKDSPYYTCPLKPYCKGVLHKMKNDFLEFTYEEIKEKMKAWGEYVEPPLEALYRLGVDVNNY